MTPLSNYLITSNSVITNEQKFNVFELRFKHLHRRFWKIHKHFIEKNKLQMEMKRML